MFYTTHYRLIIESDCLGPQAEARDLAETALDAAIRALPDGGLAACRARAICAYARGELEEVYVDHVETRAPTVEECAAYRDWLACERAADDAAYAGWAQRPRRGGLVYGVEGV